MLQYQIVPVTAFEQNCSIVWCDETMDGAVIDPGGDLPVITREAARLGVKLKAIWLTHAHIDHAGPHEDDLFWIDQLAEQSRMFRFPQSERFTPTQWLNDGDTVTIGHCTLNVRHCPGHTPGHVVFHSPEAHRAFVGDVLFAGSIGRTDFPRGNHSDLIRSITERLWPMGNDTVFIPGHGPESSFGQERESNPFVKGT